MAKRLIAVWGIMGLLLLGGCATGTESAAPTGESVRQTLPTIPEESAPDHTAPPAPEETASREHAATQPETKSLLPPLAQPRNEDFVAVADAVPGILTELKYATEDNITGQALYPFQEAYLRHGTAQKLASAAQELEQLGYGLKIWDAYRPVSAQFALWEACPDPNYVANPNRGFSNHTRGNAVDVTLVDAEGREVEMPTGFDDFSELADRDYSDCPAVAAENAMVLQTVMERHGFRGYQGEWWHFSDSEGYDVETVFDPGDFSWWYADCREYISLRSYPSTDADVLCRIPKQGQFLLMGYDEGFGLVQWEGFRGYVLMDYIAPLG